jgi:histidinol-phosphate aminotransferase
MTRINLDANESPWANGLNRYPQQQPPALTEALASYFSVQPNQLLATRGSDEGIDCLVRLFCSYRQDSVVICPPTFGMYAISAQLQGAAVINAPLTQPDYTLDPDSLLTACEPNSKLIFLCSPNNPTGGLIPLSTIRNVCEQRRGQSIIIVDEAYIDFANSDSAIELINNYDNLVVLRTFSKAFGLAAARVGVVLAQASIIAALKRILPPYPLPTTSSQAVINALQPIKLKQTANNTAILNQERDKLSAELNQLDCVKRTWLSAGNFILVQFKRPVINRCRNQGIQLRCMQSRMQLRNAARLSIGTPDENQQLLAVLRSL